MPQIKYLSIVPKYHSSPAVDSRDDDLTNIYSVFWRV